MKGLIIGLLGAVLFLGAGVASAQTTYDHTTGNQYNTIGNTTYGYNPRTGSRWQTTNQGNRSYGIDSDGNSWSYDRRSGTYSNPGAGEFRQNSPNTGSPFGR
ncbi:hypothetical protein [Thioalkalivibrio sp. ALE23]|uniref:hypothetical protein n=1 Tax=Thioalkalivibrio sp. ALE23 TaxID=1265495 RepID=UPI0003765F60|nr:hypothetical protein [Thioalkalivibrio sp. ALE23]